MSDLVRDFNRYYYLKSETTWRNTFWRGIKTYKCPTDLWIYQEIIFDLKPDWIIETGTKYGGSALFLANMCDLNNKGYVITIDIKRETKVKHRRVHYLYGSSTTTRIRDQVARLVSGTVLLILDSDHREFHVTNELEVYGNIASYIIVEDTNLGHIVEREGYPPGPMEAVEKFLKSHKDWELDKDKAKFMLTFNPNGYLCRTSK